MKLLFNLFVAFALASYVSCVGDTSTQQNNNGENELADTTAPVAEGNLPQKPNCPVAGKVLEGNEFWASDENLIVAISADEETEDPGLGESHRILQVIDGNSCQQVFRQVLPINFSADYPYYLSEITYNKVSKIVAIRGFEKLYIFDLASKKLTGPLAPAFLNERFFEDAQSGSIARLELWENYLIGNTASIGAFVFDLSNPAQPKPVLASAEYELEKGVRYNSLFMLKSNGPDGNVQLFLPTYDPDTDRFSVNPVFAEPRKLETAINKSFRNNRFLVLKEFVSASERVPVAIDMSKPKLVDLPADIANKKDTEIIEWLKRF